MEEEYYDDTEYTPDDEPQTALAVPDRGELPQRDPNVGAYNYLPGSNIQYTAPVSAGVQHARDVYDQRRQMADEQQRAALDAQYEQAQAEHQRIQDAVAQARAKGPMTQADRNYLQRLQVGASWAFQKRAEGSFSDQEYREYMDYIRTPTDVLRIQKEMEDRKQQKLQTERMMQANAIQAAVVRANDKSAAAQFKDMQVQAADGSTWTIHNGALHKISEPPAKLEAAQMKLELSTWQKEVAMIQSQRQTYLKAALTAAAQRAKSEDELLDVDAVFTEAEGKAAAKFPLPEKPLSKEEKAEKAQKDQIRQQAIAQLNAIRQIPKEKRTPDQVQEAIRLIQIIDQK